MRERPILFSGPMVCAILDGRKTQTRRIVKPQPEPDSPSSLKVEDGVVMFCGARHRCPYGVPGDRLWVRETFSFVGRQGVWDLDDAQRNGVERWLYRADSDVADSWYPSIHMPRAASRLTLEVTGVRVERVRDLSDADALAEGFASRDEFFDLFFNVNKRAEPTANPWVWVIEFTRTEVSHAR